MKTGFYANALCCIDALMHLVVIKPCVHSQPRFVPIPCNGRNKQYFGFLFVFIKKMQARSILCVNVVFLISVLTPGHARKNINNLNDLKFSKVASFGNGRLGNQLCNFASQLTLFSEYGTPCYLSEYSLRLLQNTFIMKRLNDKKDKVPFSVVNEGNIDQLSWIHVSNYNLMYNRSEVLNQFKYSWFIKLDPYVCDIKGFFPHLEEIRKTYLQFQPKVKREAKRILQDLQRTRHKNTKYISIHIRMTDIEHHLKKLFGLSMTSKEYFTNAIMLARQKVESNVTFLVFSDDIEKASKLIFSEKTKDFDIEFPLVDGGSPTTRITLAILSLSEGSILTYSTFGLWGALLRKKQNNIFMPREIIETDIGKYVVNSDLSRNIYFI